MTLANAFAATRTPHRAASALLSIAAALGRRLAEDPRYQIYAYQK